MKTKLTLFIIVLITLSLYLFNTLSTAHQQKAGQKATISHTEELETYEYIVTSLDETGLYGQSTSDDTGIFIDHKTLKGLSLNESDIIKVNFPKDDYETITHIEKVSSNLIKESFTVTSYDSTTGEYEAVNNRDNTDKENLFFTDKDIQRTSKLNVNDTVTAYYKQLEGEDLFIKVK